MAARARELAARLKALALELGFDDARVTGPEAALEDLARLDRWIDAERHGEMAYMARETAQRADPAALLPGARSVLALACSYYPGDPPEAPPGAVSGRVARYAWGRDYHRVIGKKLKLLRKHVEALAPGTRSRGFIDASPLLERAFARRAGLGFIGKNTMLIHRRLGSWVFLAALVTTLELPLDEPDPGDCGSCRLCLDACPTGAFPGPYELDATRCISYWTIEAAGEAPPELARRLGDWIFGCDVCQEVCPYNHKPLPAVGLERFQGSRTAGSRLDAAELSRVDAAELRRRFKKSPLTRAGASGIARNARTVLENARRGDSLESGVRSPKAEG